VVDAELLLPATLALHLGIQGLVECFLDLGRRPGQANRGDKFVTLLMSALAGDCSASSGGSPARAARAALHLPAHLGLRASVDPG
jgi:hypothetical protein